VDTVTATPVDPSAREALIRGGMEEVPGEARLEAPLQKLVDYAYWKMGKEGYKEPKWHRELDGAADPDEAL
jgi:hypothetical protein